MTPGHFLLAIWAVVALLIWVWAWMSSRGTGGGEGEAVFLAIAFGVGLTWPAILIVLLGAFLVFRWRRHRRAARG